MRGDRLFFFCGIFQRILPASSGEPGGGILPLGVEFVLRPGTRTVHLLQADRLNHGRHAGAGLHPTPCSPRRPFFFFLRIGFPEGQKVCREAGIGEVCRIGRGLLDIELQVPSGDYRGYILIFLFLWCSFAGDICHPVCITIVTFSCVRLHHCILCSLLGTLSVVLVKVLHAQGVLFDQ